MLVKVSVPKLFKNCPEI